MPYKNLREVDDIGCYLCSYSLGEHSFSYSFSVLNLSFESPTDVFCISVVISTLMLFTCQKKQKDKEKKKGKEKGKESIIYHILSFPIKFLSENGKILITIYIFKEKEIKACNLFKALYKLITQNLLVNIKHMKCSTNQEYQQSSINLY